MYIFKTEINKPLDPTVEETETKNSQKHFVKNRERKMCGHRKKWKDNINDWTGVKAEKNMREVVGCSLMASPPGIDKYR